MGKIRFMDGETEQKILRERYRNIFTRLITPAERVIWELGFDHGVDDPGDKAEESESKDD